jgi:hypothetical protein
MTRILLKHKLRYHALLTFLLLVAGCSAPGIKILYPMFDVKDVNNQADNCANLDRYIQQVDSIRWSMRKDGVELETEFEQMVQLSLATASAVALAPLAIATTTPDLLIMPYAVAYTNPDRLKRADALLIALMTKRQDLNCAPHPRCRITGDESGSLFDLRDTRQNVEKGVISEEQGILELTNLLDGLCPEGAMASKD